MLLEAEEEAEAELVTKEEEDEVLIIVRAEMIQNLKGSYIRVLLM